MHSTPGAVVYWLWSQWCRCGGVLVPIAELLLKYYTSHQIVIRTKEDISQLTSNAFGMTDEVPFSVSRTIV